MTSSRRVVIGKSIFILILFIHFCAACKRIEDRKEGSVDPIAQLSVIPDDDTFAVGSLFIINCTGIKPESPFSDEKYLILDKIKIFVNDVMDRNLCRFDKNNKNAVETCIQTINATKIETLEISCQVQNAWGCRKHQKSISIEGKQKPYLTEQPPRHINVTEGMDLTMRCTSPIVPRSTITWYKDNVTLTEHTITWYRGTSTLKLVSLNANLQGKYVCKAANALGEIKSNASWITVFSRPRINLGPVNQSVAIGNRISMVCSVTGLPIPVISWIKDGVELKSGTGNDVDSNRSVVVVSMLANKTSASTRTSYIKNASSVTPSLLPLTSVFTPPISISATTVYRSKAPTSTVTQPIPQTSTTAEPSLPTSILAEPSLPTSTPTEPSLPTSTTAEPSLPTSTTAEPSLPTSTISGPTSPTNTVIVSNPPSQFIFAGKITQIGRQSTLVIDSVTQADEGRYQCYARNAIGNTTSLQALLLVYNSEKPRFVASPRNASVLTGFNATMNCTAIGHPAPNITWYKNMLPIARGRVSMMTNGNTSVLMITSVVNQDQGTYRCKAENSLGSRYSLQALLHVKDISQLSVSSRSTNAVIPILVTVLPLLLIIMVVLLVTITKKRIKLKQQHTAMTAYKNEIEGVKNEGLSEDEFRDDFVYLLLMGIDRDWEIPRDRLSITNQRLGAGCFGQVDKGIYTRKDGKEMFVAVKTLKDPGIQSERDDILAELEMLKRVRRHPNIVSLVGACTREDPLCIIVEFVEGGDLNELLLKSRLPKKGEIIYENIRSRLNDRDLMKIALDIARGMKHLHEKNCIHRDLAARNILIGKGLVAKIADFGLARHVIDGLYVKQTAGKVPWKWMAPESLQGLFTPKSDVWSFGILLWEIATLGDLPYGGITQLVALYNLLLTGYRMSKPPHCDELLYSAMMDCWSGDANKRPEFGDIYKVLENMLNQKERIYINLEEMENEELNE